MRAHYLSLDPCMKGRMIESRSYAQPQRIGDTVVGGTVGIAEKSRRSALCGLIVGMLHGRNFGKQLVKLA